MKSIAGIARRAIWWFVEALTEADYAGIASLMVENLASMTLLFYGFAVYEGYKFSFRAQNQSEGGKI